MILTNILNWTVALALLPLVWRDADRRLGGRLLLGALLGLPVGAALLGVADVVTLKLAAGVLIGILTWMMVFGGPGLHRPGWTGDLVMGGFGGALGASIAEPGPTAAARMNALGLDKDRVRATMLLFFAIASPPVILGQSLGIGLDRATLVSALWLLPTTLGGLALGQIVAGRVSQRLFRAMVIGLLFATAASLLINAIWTLM